jgi:excisionase family DNA binding protein
MNIQFANMFRFTILTADFNRDSTSLLKIIMENPFEIIQNKLDSIKELVEKLISNQVASRKKNEMEIMTIDEASAFLFIAKQTIYGFVCKRQIPHFKRGKRLYFKRDDLLNWVLEAKVKTVKEIENDAANYLLRKRRY